MFNVFGGNSFHLKAMPLIPYRPFHELERFFNDDDLLSTTKSKRTLREPRMDIYKEDGNLIVEAELPGVEPDNVDINVTEDTLKIRAKHEQEEETEEKGYYKKEMNRGFFKRALPLPVKVKNEEAEASYDDGVLKITIPEQEQQKEKQEGTKVEIE